MNRLTIIGNLTKDPELRTTQSGIPVCTFTVAVNAQDKSEYFRVTAWRKQAETCSKYLTKGKKVAVVGSVSGSAYIDKNGEAKTSLEVTALEVEFLSPKGNANNLDGFMEIEIDESELPFG